MAKGRVETTLLSLCVRVLQGWSGSSYHGTDISLVYYNLMQVRDSTLTFRIRELPLSNSNVNHFIRCCEAGSVDSMVANDPRAVQ
jgi:hypothetical protein